VSVIHVREAITRAHHEEWARVVATLARRFVRAAHRVRGDAPRVGVALEHVEGLVVDDRLGDRQVWRGGRELEDRASLAVGCCG
jgi:hypothetical protein